MENEFWDKTQIQHFLGDRDWMREQPTFSVEKWNEFYAEQMQKTSEINRGLQLKGKKVVGVSSETLLLTIAEQLVIMNSMLSKLNENLGGIRNKI